MFFKKAILKVLLLLALAGMLAGCFGRGGSTPPPPALKVTLSANPSHDWTAPYEFTFTATVENLGSDTPTYDWDFGDGSSHETGAGPKTHTYSQTGPYTARVTVTAGSRTANDTETVGAWGQMGTSTLSLPSGAEARKALISGNYAYVSAGSAGLKIVEINNPRNPNVVATIWGGSGDPSVYMAQVVGNDLYLATPGSGIYRVDITNPLSPGTPTQIDSNSAYSLFVSGNYLYAGGGDGKLRRINLASNPPNLEATSAGFGASINDVHLSGNWVFAATNSDTSGVKIIPSNFGNDANPSYTLTVNYKTPQSVWVEGNYAYVAFQSGTGSLKIYDVSGLPPGPVGEFTLGAWGSHDVIVKNGYAYVADGGSGLRVFNVSNPSTPTQVVVFDTTRTAAGVWVDGYYAAVADWDGGLAVFCVGP
ncbi:MAG: PKD domain-containing protein [Bacillota bacterium]